MYLISINVPLSHSDAIRAALAQSGAGTVKCYDSACFSSTGVGRWRTLAGAKPFIGTLGVVEQVEEEKIETEVKSAKLLGVLSAVRAAHPYEAPAIHVTELLDWETLFGQRLSAGQNASTLAFAHLRGKSILIEGLDGTGKSTLCRNLCSILSAVPLRTPPDAMRPFREFFDLTRRDLREGYYMCGNFMAGEELKRHASANSIVVLDRYFPGTLAYQMGIKTDVDLPAPGDPVYEYPAGLARPTYSFVLTLPEDIRVERREGRLDVPETAEEALLRERSAISGRINEAYKRFGCVEISALGTPHDVVQRILAALNVAA